MLKSLLFGIALLGVDASYAERPVDYTSEPSFNGRFNRR